MSSNNYKFDVEVSKILNLVINSLYTNKDIAIRELISNASDACDKLRYLAIQDEKFSGSAKELKIDISIDKKNRNLVIEDSGIGMNKDDLVNNLGTIAHSGTDNFLKSLTGDKKKDMQLIGQFGVGFYSAFMISDKVTVLSKKINEDNSFKWESEGKGEFSISEEKKDTNGTKITLHIKKEEEKFLDEFHIKNIIQTYSDHISIKINFIDEKNKSEVINSSSALWATPKHQIDKEKYHSFYKHVSNLPGEPFMILHNQVEGKIDYTNLLFIPSMKPFDLFHPDRKGRVKLYVKKVYISDEIDLIPAWLRFIRGVIDSQDLPLNVSRETLQYNNVLAKIKRSVIKRVLSELNKKFTNSKEDYIKFWNDFGPVLKEGLCEATEFKNDIFDISLFYSSKSLDKLISLKEYLERKKEKQDKIYYLTGESIDRVKNSPKLEGFVNKDIEVLFLLDPVDDFWVTVSNSYQENEFQSINRSDIDLDKLDEKEKDKENEDIKNVTNNDLDEVNKFIKEILKDKIKESRSSKKLTTSAVCLSVDAGSMDIRMEKYLVEQKQLSSTSAKILEINPDHPIIQSLKKQISINKEKSEELVKTLFDQACILEGEEVSDPNDFALRLEKLISSNF